MQIFIILIVYNIYRIIFRVIKGDFMRMMNLLKHNRILKRGLALLLAVMVLVSAVDMLMVSVMATDGTVYEGDSYTVITNGINFDSISGNAVYTIKRKKPVYTYTRDGNTLKKTVSGYDENSNYENAYVERMKNENNQEMTDINGNPVYVVKDDTRDIPITHIDIKDENANPPFASTECAISSEWNDNGTAKKSILICEDDEWTEVVVQAVTVSWNTEEIVYEWVDELDEEGNHVLDEEGNHVQIKKPKQAVDENSQPIYDENNNPVYETVTVHNSKEVWETTGETPPGPVAPSTEQGFEVSFPNSNNSIETKTVQLVSGTPVELELKSGTNLNQPLLFMNLESGPDVYGAYAANKNKKYLSGDNNTSEFTVQAPENETKTLVKKWQDNAEPKNSDNIYI